MKTSLTRRQALKAGTLAASAAFVDLPSLFAKSPSYNAEFLSMTDEERAFYYFEGQEGVKARLFANENPFGPSEKAIAAITNSLKKNRSVRGCFGRSYFAWRWLNSTAHGRWCCFRYEGW